MIRREIVSLLTNILGSQLEHDDDDDDEMEVGKYNRNVDDRAVVHVPKTTDSSAGDMDGTTKSPSSSSSSSSSAVQGMVNDMDTDGDDDNDNKQSEKDSCAISAVMTLEEMEAALNDEDEDDDDDGCSDASVDDKGGGSDNHSDGDNNEFPDAVSESKMEYQVGWKGGEAEGGVVVEPWSLCKHWEPCKLGTIPGYPS